MLGRACETVFTLKLITNYPVTITIIGLCHGYVKSVVSYGLNKKQVMNQIANIRKVPTFNTFHSAN
jgi:hypothetical protein